MSRSAIHWFEIPVADIDRAQHFYETLLAKSLRREEMGPQTLAVFPYDDGQGIGGALLKSATAPAPGTDGALIYLNASPSLDAVLSRASELGAEVLLPKLALPRNIGFIAQIVDCEGNRIGLHSPTA
ncbi:MAG: VOC family protein [Burkholderiaceae bacterium]|jgi:predicted enzyme related to lactoylglutathione lyase